MEIECPGCTTRETWTQTVLTAGSLDWICPKCRRGWEVRTVFFETDEGWPDASVGGLIRQLRKEQALSQGQLGELGGISAAYVSTIEHGRRRPTPSVARRLLEALGAHAEIP